MEREILENGYEVIEKDENINGGEFSVVLGMTDKNGSRQYAVWTYRGTDTSTTFSGDYYNHIWDAAQRYLIRIKKEWDASAFKK